jgi:hypothetical protein
LLEIVLAKDTYTSATNAGFLQAGSSVGGYMAGQRLRKAGWRWTGPRTRIVLL